MTDPSFGHRRRLLGFRYEFNGTLLPVFSAIAHQECKGFQIKAPPILLFTDSETPFCIAYVHQEPLVHFSIGAAFHCAKNMILQWLRISHCTREQILKPGPLR